MSLNMQNLISWLFDSVCDFVLSEPVIYIFGIILAIWIVKLFKSFISI